MRFALTPMMITDIDVSFIKHAIRLGCEAESRGNLPIGAVISLDGKIISEGQNNIWVPVFNANRHAEIEVLRNVPPDLWSRSAQMTLYTTLEPCLMCLGAILLHHIGRVVYGSADHYGGACRNFGHLPPYFDAEAAKTVFIGPALPTECDLLAERVLEHVQERRKLFLP